MLAAAETAARAFPVAVRPLAASPPCAAAGILASLALLPGLSIAGLGSTASTAAALAPVFPLAALTLALILALPVAVAVLRRRRGCHRRRYGAGV